MGEEKKIETVDIELKVKLPTRYYKFLLNLGQLVGKTSEEIITEEVYCLLKSFMKGGYVEAWIEYAINKNEDLESLMQDVEDQVFSE